MYFTSSATRRKLIGTRMRPDPDTPNSAVSRRDELWLTIATRSPTPIPSSSRPAAIARARSATWRYVSVPHDCAGWSGSSTMASRSG